MLRPREQQQQQQEHDAQLASDDDEDNDGALVVVPSGGVPAAVGEDDEEDDEEEVEEAVDDGYFRELIIERNVPETDEFLKMVNKAETKQASKARIIMALFDFVCCLIMDPIYTDEERTRLDTLHVKAADSLDEVLRTYPLKQQVYNGGILTSTNGRWPQDFLEHLKVVVVILTIINTYI